MKSADHINIDGFKHISYRITALSEEEAVTKSESYFLQAKRKEIG